MTREVYRDHTAVRKLIRDTCTGETDTVVVDELMAFEQVRRFLAGFLPAQGARALLYEGQEPLFHKYGIHDESLQRPPPLPPVGARPTPVGGRAGRTERMPTQPQKG